MDLYKYQKEVSRTFAELGSLKMNIAHMALGMVAELAELNTAVAFNDRVNIGEEITDIKWFLANYCRLHGISYEWIGSQCEGEEVPQIEHYQEIFINLTNSISELTDVEKKFIAYNKEIDIQTRVDKALEVYKAIQSAYLYFNLDASACMDNNIAKLRIRFPEKFTDALANNRDLKMERIELEKL